MKTFKEYIKDLNGKQEFVSKAGAGEWGRPESVQKYVQDTPGQSVELYKKNTN
jgi:hypothetical protein